MIGSGSVEEDYRDKSAQANRSEISVAHRSIIRLLLTVASAAQRRRGQAGIHDAGTFKGDTILGVTIDVSPTSISILKRRPPERWLATNRALTPARDWRRTSMSAFGP